MLASHFAQACLHLIHTTRLVISHRATSDITTDLCPDPQAAWLLKCRAMTERAYVDDLEWDEEGIADALMDDNSTAQAPRPGTSMARGATAVGGRVGTSMRPTTASGRPVTGFSRPATSSHSRTGGVGGGRVDTALRAARVGTSRAMTSLGRTIRLGTASMLSAPGGPFIAVDRLDLRTYSTPARAALGKALMDYLLYVEHNPRKGMELASAATAESNYNDWWWKERLGKCYYQLGLFRDSEKQLASAAFQQPMVATALQVARVTERLDQPLAALNQLSSARDRFPGDPILLLAAARVQENIGDLEQAAGLYRQALQDDAINVEALACLAANAFYSDQPEISLRYYRRLLQLGVDSCELWCDLALACFYSGQYDLAVPCVERAIAQGEDDTAADVWYNIGTMCLSLGDVPGAEQCWQICLSQDPSHPEAHINCAILDMRKGKNDAASAHLTAATQQGEQLYELWYNRALLCYRQGDVAEAFTHVSRALEIQPGHTESVELMRAVRSELAHV